MERILSSLAVFTIMGAKVYDVLMNLRKKLIYQSWHRGMRENDFLLGAFADAFLPTFFMPE